MLSYWIFTKPLSPLCPCLFFLRTRWVTQDVGPLLKKGAAPICNDFWLSMVPMRCDVCIPGAPQLLERVGILGFQILFDPGYISAMATILKTWLTTYPGLWAHTFFPILFINTLGWQSTTGSCTGGRTLCKETQKQEGLMKNQGPFLDACLLDFRLKKLISWLLSPKKPKKTNVLKISIRS